MALIISLDREIKILNISPLITFNKVRTIINNFFHLIKIIFKIILITNISLILEINLANSNNNSNNNNNTNNLVNQMGKFKIRTWIVEFKIITIIILIMETKILIILIILEIWMEIKVIKMAEIIIMLRKIAVFKGLVENSNNIKMSKWISNSNKCRIYIIIIIILI